MTDIKIQITGEAGILIAKEYGLEPFHCECVLNHEREVHEHFSGDNVHKPIELAGITEVHRSYLVVRHTQEKTFSLSEIKKAFWAKFHQKGELWFDYLGTPEENEEATTGSWEEFLQELLNASH